MIKFSFLVSLIFFLTGKIFSQTDINKWEKKEISYLIPVDKNHREFSFTGESADEVIAKTFTNGYWFFISEIDGDNCPFHPSCSSFFVEAVKETNIIKGTLMFFDRFTRDSNFFFRNEHYPLSKYGYYDPPSLYRLNEEKINYIPPSVFVNE